jgi:leader peptidase (prepilin peptidase)/N-methyltransferase
MNMQPFLDLCYIAVLLAVSLVDLREKRIPNKIIVPAIGLALVAMFLTLNWKSALVGAFFGGLFMLIPVMTLGKRGGMGDVKMAFFMGLILGFPAILFALIVAHLSALGLWIGVWVKRLNRKSVVPFGPFLAFGTFVFLLLPYLPELF